MIRCHVCHLLPIALLLIPISVPAREDMPTDLELVRATLVNALGKHLHDLPLPSNASITVDSDGTKDDNNWIIQHELTKSLLDRGYNVVATSHQDTLHLYAAADSTVAMTDTSQGSKPPQMITHSLLFRIVDLKLNYAPQSRFWVFGKSIRRSATLSLTLRIVDHRDGTTIGALWINGSQSNTVPKRDLPLLETTKSIKKQTLSHSRKWAEFFTAAGMMAGIIFIAF